MVMFTPGVLDRDPRLGHALRRVRTRYGLRVLVRGLALLVAGMFLGVGFAAYGLDAFRYSKGSVVAFTALLYLWIAFLAARFVVIPLWRGHRQASDTAIARYIEEHDPSLDAALRSAVNVVASESGTGESPTLRSQLVDDVVRRLERLNLPREVERLGIRQAAIALGVVTAACLR